MSKSKSKGSAFERLVARLIIDEFNKRGFKFVAEDCYRTPGSGGHVYASKQNPSDLVLSDRLLYYFPFTIECKRDERYDLTHFFVPIKDHQKSWKEQHAVEQVISANTPWGLETINKRRYPMVIFQTNRNPIFCFTPADAYHHLFGAVNQEINLPVNWNGHWWVLCLFKPFLKSMIERAVKL